MKFILILIITLLSIHTAFKRQPLKLPVKIEPKTFFANERTFLQWLNTLLLLAVGSSAFIAYGSAPFQVCFVEMFLFFLF